MLRGNERKTLNRLDGDQTIVRSPASWPSASLGRTLRANPSPLRALGFTGLLHSRSLALSESRCSLTVCDPAVRLRKSRSNTRRPNTSFGLGLYLS